MSEIAETIEGRKATGATCPKACRRHAARAPLWTAVGWLFAALMALSVTAVPYDFGESLCGVWGCFPPIPALVAMHLFWCVVLGAGVHVICKSRPGLLRPIGAVLVLAAVVGAAVVIGSDLNRWLELPDKFRSYWPRRVAYILAVTTDIPLGQSLVAGFVCLVLGRLGFGAISGRGASCDADQLAQGG